MPTPPPPEKPKEDRVRETITILKKLEEVGIGTFDPGYELVKGAMREWVNTGVAASLTVEFPRFGRRGELVLPARADRSASLNLKVVRVGRR